MDVDDIADVAIAALTTENHTGQLYELTGPRLMTFEEAVGEIVKAAGRPIQYQAIPMEAYKAMLVEYNIPDDFIWLVTYLFAEVLTAGMPIPPMACNAPWDAHQGDFSDLCPENRCRRRMNA